jgi:predicted RNA-binding Zn ribbon-like protein
VARQAPVYRFDFSGGNLGLDFVNTVGDRPRWREEHLFGWRDFVSWGEQAGLLSKRDAGAVRRASESRPQEADRAFARTLALRESLYRIFSALAAAGMPEPADVTELNVALGEAMTHARLESRGREFVWGWTAGEPMLARILWPVVRAAAELLASPDRTVVRECASDRCSWMFLDRSRTHRRRWCSMKSCGNRAKARRFYERQRRTRNTPVTKPAG